MWYYLVAPKFTICLLDALNFTNEFNSSVSLLTVMRQVYSGVSPLTIVRKGYSGVSPPKKRDL